ncbi:sugar transferase [Paenibacillus sp. J2TS4]|uniref:sugar transferase n=1 Tax=Paenibacillus sp. J2TS4 TaxID=2807194 RepID=UPI001B2EF7A6|nr:sugar transferase [Paenibacillus sp. J2TS4]GIP35022.1 hypothetical protein J2TS4_42320 [Paenibacillus sp. J2TS4]
MTKILQVCAIDVSVDALLKPMVLASMAAGYTVHNACTDTGRFAELTRQGLTMIEVPIARKISPVSNLKSIMALYRLMRQEKYDIVHVHTPVAALLGRVAAKLAGVKHIIYTAHGFYFHEGMSSAQYKFFYGLEKYSARWITDWLLLQSREDYELCVQDRFKAEERIIHISNGVDIYNKFNEECLDEASLALLKKEFKLRDSDVVFSFIGRFVREKGIFELLEAFHRLKQEHPQAKLLMIGDVLASDRDQEANRKLVELLQDSSIITPGFRKDIPELLSISDVYVLPSYREGLPRSIIEAMAMGKPVIATNIRGCREEIVHGHNGYLVEKEDSEDLFLHMLQLVDDKAKRIVFGQKSREMVEELFNEEKVIGKQLELFDQLTKPGRARRGKRSRSRLGSFLKRAFDLTAALGLLAVLSPLMIVVACLVRIKLGSPILFKQMRPGLHSKPFYVYKFRTMTNQRDERGALLPDHVRLTSFGKLLRKFSLDELPQLFNVLKGDLSLVGPRPLLMEYLSLYTDEQRRRQEARPGITGWAQVNGRNAISWEQKFELDVWYVDHQSFWLDIKILWLTFYKVIKSEGINQQGQATMEPFKGTEG